ncbi:DDE-type integrase/transposase/recombinase [Ixodes scapularis]
MAGEFEVKEDNEEVAQVDDVVQLKDGPAASAVATASRPASKSAAPSAEAAAPCKSPQRSSPELDDMARRQRDDPELRALIEHLEGRGATVPRVFSRAPPTFVLRQGVLYKENFGDNSTPWLLVIPTDLRAEIFQACHDDPTSGHLGYSRTLARIRERFYWPKLPKTVHFYTRSCHECQRRKKPPTKPAGTAVEIAKFFIESIVLRHGAPEVLISDRGSSFMAQLTQEILRLSHTSHRRTTAYHPQTNGLTERLNKTIADMISMYVDVEHKTWDEVLPYVTFAYNTAVQETTGVTPFQLVHGRKVTTMLDVMLPHEPAVDGSDDAQVVVQRAEEVRQLARHRIQAQQRVDTGRYNLRRRDVHFQPGDRVWVWTPIRRRGLSEKLLKRYFGPYKVLRRLGDLNYEVMPDGRRTSSRRAPRPEVVHAVSLKPYYAR